jgi:hypothetical protein
MTAGTEPASPPIGDDEIRDWARSTGRAVGTRGVLSPRLRAEYEAIAASSGAHVGDADPVTQPIPVVPPEPAPAGAESPPPRPRAAKAETRPRPVRQASRSPLSRARAWLNGSATAKPAAKGRAPKVKVAEGPARPRTPVTDLAEFVWNQTARAMEHFNPPVARTMAWQAPYIGIVADDVLAATPVDKILQPIARMQHGVSGAGAMIAMPFVVGAITSERNDPELHGMPAAVRQQFLQSALESCIESQLKMFGTGNLAERIQEAAASREQLDGDIAAIRDMIFATLPAPVTVPEGASAADVEAARVLAEQNAERERQLRAAVAAVRFMPQPGPDLRGQAAERAAAATAASAAAAAAATNDAIARAAAGTPR